MKKFFVIFCLLVCIHSNCVVAMPQESYDVIVIGLGAMGSAATYQLAKAHVKVLGIDKFQPPHEYGSSYGDTRMTRLAIGEGQEYVPLVFRSNEIWREIEKESGQKLLFEVGGLIIGTTESVGHGIADFIKNTTKIAEQNHIEHSRLDSKQIHAKFPEFNVSGIEQGYYETHAGYLIPEKCIAAELALAKRYGANLQYNETMISFINNNNDVTVITNKSTYKTKKLILTTGAWMNEILPEYAQYFKVYRQVQYWFALKDPKQYSSYNHLPAFVWLYGNESDDVFYGFPAIDGPNGGIKIATEKTLTETTPSSVDRKVTQAEIDDMYAKFKNRMPGVSSNCIKALACLYTITPDHRFIIDYLPKTKNVIVVSACSGHGFKHSAAIGELLMEMATNGKTTLDASKLVFTPIVSY